MRLMRDRLILTDPRFALAQPTARLAAVKARVWLLDRSRQNCRSSTKSFPWPRLARRTPTWKAGHLRWCSLPEGRPRLVQRFVAAQDVSSLGGRTGVRRRLGPSTWQFRSASAPVHAGRRTKRLPTRQTPVTVEKPPSHLKSCTLLALVITRNRAAREGFGCTS